MVIVGAGIAGPVLGVSLLKKGLKVALVDPYKEFRTRVCGEYLCPSGVDILNRLLRSEALSHQYLHVEGMRVFSDGGVAIESKFNSIEVMDGVSTIGLSLERKHFETEIRKMFIDAGGASFLGFRVRKIFEKVYEDHKNILGWEVIAEGEERESSSLEENKNSILRINAKLLIGADGRKSFISEALHLNRPPFDKRLAIHTEMETVKQNERFGEMHLFKSGVYIGLNPIQENLTNITLVCYPEDLEKDGHGKPINLLQKYMKESPRLKTLFGEHIMHPHTKLRTVWPLSHRVSNVAGKNWALIGDASGFLDPLTGEGITMALGAIEILSKVLDSNTIKDPVLLEKALSQYRSEKLARFRQKYFINRFFQFVIHRTFVVNLIGRFLIARPKRADYFIAIISNTLTPLKGLMKLFLT